VPVTGNASASDQKKSTNVTIEDEKLTIDLHQEIRAPALNSPQRGSFSAEADQGSKRRKSAATAGAAFSRNRVQGASKNR
jgi:hypothetical protein